MMSLTDTVLIVAVTVQPLGNAEDKSCINGIMEVCKRSKRRLSRLGGVATHAKRMAFTALVRPYNIDAVDATRAIDVCTFAKFQVGQKHMSRERREIIQ